MLFFDGKVAVVPHDVACFPWSQRTLQRRFENMHLPEMLDNVNKSVIDDLTATVKNNDRLSVAAACFSIYAYQALKPRMEGGELSTDDTD